MLSINLGVNQVDVSSSDPQPVDNEPGESDVMFPLEGVFCLLSWWLAKALAKNSASFAVNRTAMPALVQVNQVTIHPKNDAHPYALLLFETVGYQPSFAHSSNLLL